MSTYSDIFSITGTNMRFAKYTATYSVFAGTLCPFHHKMRPKGRAMASGTATCGAVLLPPAAPPRFALFCPVLPRFAKKSLLPLLPPAATEQPRTPLSKKLA